jgi:hypothetical protein
MCVLYMKRSRRSSQGVGGSTSSLFGRRRSSACRDHLIERRAIQPSAADGDSANPRGVCDVIEGITADQHEVGTFAGLDGAPLRAGAEVFRGAHVTTTGVIFGLIVVSHAGRMFVEPHLATHPGYIALTAVATLLSLWAGRLAWRSRSP